METSIHKSNSGNQLYQALNPSEKTLNLIKQIAYTSHRINLNGKSIITCLN
ncbi:MAG: hypothetical protein LKF48_03695 [Prevotella sp.]|jgi:hypothetical protein|nr:hypothetical protein [Prevotella sp.]MCH4182257.1 hypothetical protein [Prevotella sp.]MCH4211284.1 hypothetical protein [Prevotella sp.]MCH4241637.1 hypothetical protein [Prevotella sp.]